MASLVAASEAQAATESEPGLQRHASSSRTLAARLHGAHGCRAPHWSCCCYPRRCRCPCRRARAEERESLAQVQPLQPPRTAWRSRRRWTPGQTRPQDCRAACHGSSSLRSRRLQLYTTRRLDVQHGDDVTLLRCGTGVVERTRHGRRVVVRRAALRARTVPQQAEPDGSERARSATCAAPCEGGGEAAEDSGVPPGRSGGRGMAERKLVDSASRSHGASPLLPARDVVGGGRRAL
jgi:hypothetical protein